MKKLAILLCMLFFGMEAIAHDVENISAKEALNRLKEGNKHFMSMHLKHPDQTVKKRKSLTSAQHPFVVVVTCSDSRVPSELIFDQGLGDIFEIRNAGNVLDDHVIGSVEYAVVHLGVKLVLVMGHEDCGAVTAAVNNVHESKFIDSLINSIKPAMKSVENEKTADTHLNSVIKKNAILGAENLIKSDNILSKYVKEKGLQIIPAYYHLDTGKVELLK